MNELLAQFVTEARELIEQAGADLLAMERRTGNADTVNRLFRGIHTLKGSSGLFDVGPLTYVLHAAEDLFQAVRESTVTLTPEMVDLALRVLDQVGRWIDHLETHDQLPDGAEPVAAVLRTELRAQLGEAGAAEPEARPAASTPQAAHLPPDLAARFGEGRLMEIVSVAAPARPVALISYRPEEGCLFKGEDPLYLMLQVPDLQALVVLPRTPFPPASEMDPYTCVLDLHALTFSPLDALQTLFRYVPDQVDILQLAPEALIVPTGYAGSNLPPDSLRTLLRLRRSGETSERLDLMQELSDRVPAGSLAGSRLRWLDYLFDNESFPARWASDLVASAETPNADHDRATGERMALVLTLVRQQVTLLDIEVPADEVAGRVLSAGLVAANCLRFIDDMAGANEIRQTADKAAQAGDPALLRAALATLVDRLSLPTQPPPRSADAAQQAGPDDAPERQASRTLRVDQEKIDALMNLVGELVVAKNSLPFLARKADHQFGVRELAREIKDQYGVIDRIAQELQSGIMSVRMMPVGQMFQRFPRLVRDISRKLGKQVELVIEGETTEADKNVIENLFDPLLHMVRNSLDHGIEAPDERAARGKPVAATIRLAARQDSDQVLIAVADDGRGIDPAIIKHKAFERGLIDARRLESMTDQDARMLIFTAGFSTADRISDLSGRGVGMDVVRNAVEKAGGRISVTSEIGAGTTVELSVPLSMAVTRIMTVTVGERMFGIPMDAIVETVKVGRGDIVPIKDQSAFVLRNRIVPLVSLAHLLDLPDPLTFGNEVAVLVVRVGTHTLGLAISAFGEGMEVILKPLDGILTGIRGYAGTSLLGDGRVLLILNLTELVL